MSGTPDYTYEWHGPNAFFSTDPSATVSNPTSANAGIYTLVVTDLNGCQSNIASTNVVITDAVAQPTITGNAPVCSGEQVTMQIDGYAGASVSYEWTQNGQPIANNSNVLVISPAQVSDGGLYQVTVFVLSLIHI